MHLGALNYSISNFQDVPDLQARDRKYEVRFAHSIEEIEAALKLRFEVFNLELGEGLESSFLLGRDVDEFDETCHHLIVTERATARVIGTYRLRTMEIAQTPEGFYSAAEFDLKSLPPEVLRASVELGRACIALEHRNRQVLALLWRGLALYSVRMQKRYLFGCCSLTTQNQNEGFEMFDFLMLKGHMHPSFMVPTMTGYECRRESPIGSFATEPKIPRLFESYLNVGVKVCSPPAIDRRFKTIDFLVMFDTQSIDDRTRRMFFT